MGRHSLLFSCTLWRGWKGGEGEQRKGEEERMMGNGTSTVVVGLCNGTATVERLGS